MRSLKLALAFLVAMAPAWAGAGVYDDMMRAIQIDDDREVANLLMRGVDVDTVNPEGVSLLMLAVKEGKISVIKTILASKPKINARNALL